MITACQNTTLKSLTHAIESWVRTTVPPCIVEATVAEAGELSKKVEYCFPNEIPHKLRQLSVQFMKAF